MNLLWTLIFFVFLTTSLADATEITIDPRYLAKDLDMIIDYKKYVDAPDTGFFNFGTTARLPYEIRKISYTEKSPSKAQLQQEHKVYVVVGKDFVQKQHNTKSCGLFPCASSNLFKDGLYYDFDARKFYARPAGKMAITSLTEIASKGEVTFKDLETPTPTNELSGELLLIHYFKVSDIKQARDKFCEKNKIYFGGKGEEEKRGEYVIHVDDNEGFITFIYGYESEVPDHTEASLFTGEITDTGIVVRGQIFSMFLWTRGNKLKFPDEFEKSGIFIRMAILGHRGVDKTTRWFSGEDMKIQSLCNRFGHSVTGKDVFVRVERRVQQGAKSLSLPILFVLKAQVLAIDEIHDTDSSDLLHNAKFVVRFHNGRGLFKFGEETTSSIYYYNDKSIGWINSEGLHEISQEETIYLMFDNSSK